MIELDWQILNDGVTYRSKVFGGWLVRTESWIAPAKTDITINGITQNPPAPPPLPYYSICFVPDPDHIWGRIEQVDKLLLKGNANDTSSK